MAEDKLCTGMTDEEIIRAHFDMVYRLALSQTRNITSAEDVTQEVFLRFVENRGKLTTAAHIKAWLIRVTINCSKNVFMNSWFKKTVPLTDDLTFDTPEKSEVYYAVRTLPSKYRTIIHLYYYEDMSVREIAECLTMNESTVKSRLLRGREMLRKELEGGYDIV